MMLLLCFIRSGQSADHKQHPGALRKRAVRMTAFCDRAAVSCTDVRRAAAEDAGAYGQAAEKADEADEAW